MSRRGDAATRATDARTDDAHLALAARLAALLLTQYTAEHNVRIDKGEEGVDREERPCDRLRELDQPATPGAPATSPPAVGEGDAVLRTRWQNRSVAVMAGRGRVVRQCGGRARLVVQEAFHLHEDRELEQRVVVGPIERHFEHVMRERVLLRRMARDTRAGGSTPRDGRRDRCLRDVERLIRPFLEAIRALLQLFALREHALRQLTHEPRAEQCHVHRLRAPRPEEPRLRRFMVAAMTMTIMTAIMMTMAIVKDSPCYRRRR